MNPSRTLESTDIQQALGQLIHDTAERHRAHSSRILVLGIANGGIPIAHAIAHGLEANELPIGSRERLWAIAKMVCNGVFQIWFEDRIYQDKKRR